MELGEERVHLAPAPPGAHVAVDEHEGVGEMLVGFVVCDCLVADFFVLQHDWIIINSRGFIYGQFVINVVLLFVIIVGCINNYL